MRKFLFFLFFFAYPAFADEPKTITLTVSEQELNVIGQALGELPYRLSAPLLAKLQQEVQSQQQKAPPEKPKKKD